MEKKWLLTSFNALINSVSDVKFKSAFTDKNDRNQLSVYKEFETYEVLSSCLVSSSY